MLIFSLDITQEPSYASSRTNATQRARTTDLPCLAERSAGGSRQPDGHGGAPSGSHTHACQRTLDGVCLNVRFDGV